MKHTLLKIVMFVFVLSLYNKSSAQTQGTLSFSFTPTSHGTGKHALAIWIGGFRTLVRYCDASTYNYLPTWAGQAWCGFQGTTLDATSSPCRIVGATLGPSLTNYTTQNIVWDGINNYGNLSQDGTTNIFVEETWGTGATQTAVRYFSFVKGPAVDDQTTGIPNDANFTNISLIWQPSLTTASFEAVAASIYPNPSNSGLFTIEAKDSIQNIKVLNTLGAVVFQETVALENTNSKKMDLSGLSNGVYFVSLTNSKGTSNYKVVIEK